MPDAATTKSVISDSDISVLGNHWELRAVDERASLAMAQRLDLPEFIARLLTARGISADSASIFLQPTLRDSLPDPAHLKDMNKAAKRVARAIIQKETIGIFGDYDVDGATSSALLIRYLRELGIETHTHIPDRKKEGYGPNTPALMGLRDKGASLIITVDCGTVAFAPIAAAQAAGVDVIVIDHHKGEARLPDALAIVNPNRMDEDSPHTHLAAVGMTFLLLVAVNRELRSIDTQQTTRQPDLKQWLDLVALGTVCDVVSLTGINRAFVAQGLKILAQRSNIGLNALGDVANLDEKPGTYHLGFILGPRINAGGRVGQSSLGVRLLTTQDPVEAKELAEILDRHNSERKAIESMVLEQAREQAEIQQGAPFIMVHSQGWHEGVIGIVAGRLKELYNKPAAVIAVENGIGKGSARSVSGVDIGGAIAAAHMEGLLLAGGGHAMAAGFSLEADKIPELQEWLTKHLGGDVADWQRQRVLHLDAALSVTAITPQLAQLQERLGPFGMGNPQPRILLSDVRIVKTDIVGGNHVRVLLAESGMAGRAQSARLGAVAFRAADTPLGELLLRHSGAALHLAGQLRLNEWQGRKRAEFHITDAMPAG